MSARGVLIDCYWDTVAPYRHTHAIVAIDVLRATTTATTAVVEGRRCFVVPSIERALPLAARLTSPLLVGELGGNMPYGFDETNSPVRLAARGDVERPMILLSSSGTRLIADGQGAPAVYAACLRNRLACIEHLAAAGHPQVALVGAGTRGEFREEDQPRRAWIADGLLAAGFEPENERTLEVVERWRGVSLDVVRLGHSATYLRDTGQTEDLDFVLEHVDDVDILLTLDGEELVACAAPQRPGALLGAG